MPLSALDQLDAPVASPRPRPGPRWRRERIFWVFQVLFWLGVGSTVMGLSTALRPDEPLPWGPVSLRVITGFVISSLVHRLSRLPALQALPRPQRWALVALVTSLGLVATLLYLRGGPTIWRSENGFLPLAPRLVTACMWCAIYFGIDLLDDLHESEMASVRSEAAATVSENRALKAEAVAQQHELRQLQEQMNPHFLFNALNAVAAIKDDPEAVEQVTQDLAEYLRFALREARALEPLARELHALEKYLAVQQRRFCENLVCRITADRAAPRVLVPPMMIQPLLENALNYGAQTSSMPLRVNVRASVKDDVLEVVVANSGRWVPPDPTKSPSTGIRTLRRRLELLVDDAATVDVVTEPDHDGGWVRVVIRMPATMKGPLPTHTAEPA